MLTIPNPNLKDGDDFSVDPLMANILAILAGVQSFDGSQIQPGTILASAFASGLNPQGILADFLQSFVVSGLMPTGYSVFNFTMPNGIVYVNFNNLYTKYNVAGANYTVSPSKDTYYTLKSDGTLDVPSAVANGAARPALSSGSQWLVRVRSDGSGIVGVDDLRNLNPIFNREYKALFRGYKSASSAFTASTWNAQTYDSTDINIGNSFQIVGTKIYVPYTGLYTVHVHNATNQSAGGDYLAGLSINNSGAGPQGNWTRQGATGSNPSVDLRRTVFCTVGDYIEGYAYHSQNYTILGGNAGDSSFIEVEYKGQKQN